MNSPPSSPSQIPSISCPTDCKICPLSFPLMQSRIATLLSGKPNWKISIPIGLKLYNGSDHRVRAIDLLFQKHAQAGLRVHHIVIRRLRIGQSSNESKGLSHVLIFRIRQLRSRSHSHQQYFTTPIPVGEPSVPVCRSAV